MSGQSWMQQVKQYPLYFGMPVTLHHEDLHNAEPPHSLHVDLNFPCWHIEAPPHSLH